MIQNKIMSISITKNELKIIKDSIKYQKLLNKHQDNSLLQKVETKFKKLSPYFEYKLEPIMYDEF